MRDPGFIISVKALTVLDSIRAFGILFKKTKGWKHLHLYRLKAVHAGAFAAVWAVCQVPIEKIATALAIATTGRELAELTVPENGATKCTGAVEILSGLGTFFSLQGLCIKRRFGCRRDLIETLVATTTIPTLFSGIISPCQATRHSATFQLNEMRAQLGPVTEWDVCPSVSSDSPECMSKLIPRGVEEPIGLFFLSSM